MSTYTDASLIVTPNAKKAGKLYSLKGADLDAVRATTATYVGSDGLNKTALANEVRFDYTNGSCPSILVEPQRTNLLLRSEEFGNAYWLKEAVVLTANQTTAPDGTNTADLIVDNNVSTIHGFRNNTALVLTNAAHTYSIFVKDNGRRFVNLSFNTTGSSYTSGLIADLQNGTITQIFGVGILSSSIVPFGNDGWYKISYSAVFNSNSFAYFALANSSNGLSSSGRLNYIGNGTGVFVWGAQLEAGSNATSYIPTVDSAVTRNEDVISKTGLSGITSITETFENGTTNIISGSPTSYTMSKGRIKHVIGL